jgi:hypothetical protein
MNTFINFFIAHGKSSWGSWFGFKLKCLLYDNEYFLLTFYCPCLDDTGSRVGFKLKCLLYDNEYFLLIFYCPCLIDKRKTRNQQKQRNTQVKTTDMRSDFSPMTDLLPVACCPSEQRLFLTHSLFFCTLQIHTIVLWQGNNVENDGNGN